jgi:hypothetical protein
LGVVSSGEDIWVRLLNRTCLSPVVLKIHPVLKDGFYLISLHSSYNCILRKLLVTLENFFRNFHSSKGIVKYLEAIPEAIFRYSISSIMYYKEFSFLILFTSSTRDSHFLIFLNNVGTTAEFPNRSLRHW